MDFHLARQLVRRMQERAAAACRDQLQFARQHGVIGGSLLGVDRMKAAIVMPIAGNHGDHFGALLSRPLADLMQGRIVVGLPDRRMHDDDNLLARFGLRAHRLEVVFLRFIDGLVER